VEEAEMKAEKEQGSRARQESLGKEDGDLIMHRLESYILNKKYYISLFLHYYS
jgi:hypothetical protein